jgi:hypothetical protein
MGTMPARTVRRASSDAPAPIVVTGEADRAWEDELCKIEWIGRPRLIGPRCFRSAAPSRRN